MSLSPILFSKCKKHKFDLIIVKKGDKICGTLANGYTLDVTESTTTEDIHRFFLQIEKKLKPDYVYMLLNRDSNEQYYCFTWIYGQRKILHTTKYLKQESDRLGIDLTDYWIVPNF